MNFLALARDAFYRWVANHLPRTVVVLCAVLATRMYQKEPAPKYPMNELKEVEQVFVEYAGNAAIDF